MSNKLVEVLDCRDAAIALVGKTLKSQYPVGHPVCWCGGRGSTRQSGTILLHAAGRVMVRNAVTGREHWVSAERIAQAQSNSAKSSRPQ